MTAKTEVDAAYAQLTTAIAAEQRAKGTVKDLGEVVTKAEHGFKDANSSFWTGQITNKKLTREMVDTLLPAHGRTSCSDDDLQNAAVRSGGVPRCVRCFLLRAIEFGWDEGGLRPRLTLERVI